VEPAIDWICVSPKAGTEVVQRSGHELKLVFPQSGADPADYGAGNSTNFFLQPLDGPAREEIPPRRRPLHRGRPLAPLRPNSQMTGIR
jgi:hypothetical protein